MERIPKPGEFYRHFKDKLYQILTVAEHSETGEEMVVYQALYGDFTTYVRPLSMFVSEVDHKKYPSASQRYRFEQVTPKAGTYADLAVESTAFDEIAEPTSPNQYLLRFLEVETYEERRQILSEMQGNIGQQELDSIYLVLDMKQGSGSIEEQIDGIERHLKMQNQYAGNRLR